MLHQPLLEFYLPEFRQSSSALLTLANLTHVFAVAIQASGKRACLAILSLRRPLNLPTMQWTMKWRKWLKKIRVSKLPRLMCNANFLQSTWCTATRRIIACRRLLGWQMQTLMQTLNLQLRSKEKLFHAWRSFQLHSLSAYEESMTTFDLVLLMSYAKLKRTASIKMTNLRHTLTMHMHVISRRRQLDFHELQYTIM